MELIDFTLLSEDFLDNIYKWRNNEVVRSNSFNKNKISLDEHKEFINLLKQDKTKQYFLAMFDSEPVGVISFTDIHDCSATVGYYKNPYTKHKGIGRLLIKKAIEYASYTLNLDILIMKAYKQNQISIHCITGCGFIECKTNNDIIEYQLKLNKKMDSF